MERIVVHSMVEMPAAIDRMVPFAPVDSIVVVGANTPLALRLDISSKEEMSAGLERVAAYLLKHGVERTVLVVYSDCADPILEYAAAANLTLHGVQVLDTLTVPNDTSTLMSREEYCEQQGLDPATGFTVGEPPS